MTETLYLIHRLHDDTVTVVVQDAASFHRPRPLDPAFHVRRHSPSEFEYGYAGSGPAQLALALLVDVLGDVDRALGLYQGFKASTIALLDRESDHHTLTATAIMAVVASLEGK